MILNIDTATETASIALSREGNVLELMTNEDQKDHAAWIHSAIQQVMKTAGYKLQELDAIAVTAGPGSYTGLRVGMATAKGLCYSLKVPLITESTLKVMAYAAKELLNAEIPDAVFAPMIDARRMEVFVAVYDARLNEVMQQQPMILDEHSFAELLLKQSVVFFGSGSAKFSNIIENSNALFRDVRHHAGHLSALSYASFKAGLFTGLAYADPVYLKEFYTHTKK